MITFLLCCALVTQILAVLLVTFEHCRAVTSISGGALWMAFPAGLVITLATLGAAGVIAALLAP